MPSRLFFNAFHNTYKNLRCGLFTEENDFTTFSPEIDSSLIKVVVPVENECKRKVCCNSQIVYFMHVRDKKSPKLQENDDDDDIII